MKKSFHIVYIWASASLIFFILGASPLFAQDTIPVEKLPEFKESLFVHLDTTKITTRILRDKHLFPMVDMAKFSGDSLSDTISLAQWRQDEI